MSYGVEFDSRAEAELYSWELPIELYEEVERLLAEELSEHPTRYLRNVPRVRDTMQ